MEDRTCVPGRGNKGTFSLHHNVQTGSEAHPASYPVGTGSSFSGGREVGAEVKNAWSHTSTHPYVFSVLHRHEPSKTRVRNVLRVRYDLT